MGLFFQKPYVSIQNSQIQKSRENYFVEAFFFILERSLHFIWDFIFFEIEKEIEEI